MIVYASPRAQGTDDDGNTQPISVVGPSQNELRVSDLEGRDYLQEIVKELKIMNIHLSMVTDVSIDREELEVG